MLGTCCEIIVSLVYARVFQIVFERPWLRKEIVVFRTDDAIPERRVNKIAQPSLHAQVGVCYRKGVKHKTDRYCLKIFICQHK